MPVITNIAPTTELEAVNAMLRSVGEAPLADGYDLSSSDIPADAEQALDILLETTRETLTEGWRFNCEFGLELAPVGTSSWTDSDGVTTTLNIFQKPSNVLRWAQTHCSENRDLDLVERPAKLTPSSVVLYDRFKNRDGPEAARYPYIYIDAVYAFDFQHLPETVRRFITTAAARRFAEQVFGSAQRSAFSEKDEMRALRLLKRDQGLTKQLNLFDHPEMSSALGDRPRNSGRGVTKVYPGRTGGSFTPVGGGGGLT